MHVKVSLQMASSELRTALALVCGIYTCTQAHNLCKLEGPTSDGVLTKPSSFISLDCAVIPCLDRVVFSNGFLLCGSAHIPSFSCHTARQAETILLRLRIIYSVQKAIQSPVNPSRLACRSLSRSTRHVNFS